MSVAVAEQLDPGFVHEALLYADEDEFLAGTVPFVREGVEAGEPVLVAVSAEKIERLRSELGADAAGVLFADMAEVGTNPARIIPLWQQFVDERCSGGRAVRGIGEPIWPERSSAELVECQRHESLLNLAFADAPAWRLLCPYDTSSLERAVVDEALRSHPYVVENGARRESPDYRGLEAIAEPFDEPLPAPPASAEELPFDPDSLAEVRRLVSAHAAASGLTAQRGDQLAVAAHELATNTIRHGGAAGVLRLWSEAETLVCEVEDGGRIDDPLAGRRRPELGRRGGRGLWIANGLCELVQVRCFPTGSTVRLHMRRG